MVDDLNKVIDDVNRLSKSVSDALDRTHDDVSTNKRSAEDMQETLSKLQTEHERSLYLLESIGSSNRQAVEDVSRIQEQMQNFVTPEFLRDNGFAQHEHDDPFVTTRSLDNELAASGYMPIQGIEESGFENIGLRKRNSPTSAAPRANIEYEDGGIVLRPVDGEFGTVTVKTNEIKFKGDAVSSPSSLRVVDNTLRFCPDSESLTSCVTIADKGPSI